jgi:hypothetical protein
VAAVLDGSAPAGLTITALARALPHSWAGQERLMRHLPGAAQGADVQSHESVQGRLPAPLAGVRPSFRPALKLKLPLLKRQKHLI